MGPLREILKLSLNLKLIYDNTDLFFRKNKTSADFERIAISKKVAVIKLAGYKISALLIYFKKVSKSIEMKYLSTTFRFSAKLRFYPRI